jgi:hypothetical protein
MRIVQPGNDIDLRPCGHTQSIVPQVQPQQHLGRYPQANTEYVKSQGRDVDLNRNWGRIR